jgi:hypothetical protein
MNEMKTRPRGEKITITDRQRADKMAENGRKWRTGIAILKR